MRQGIERIDFIRSAARLIFRNRVSEQAEPAAAEPMDDFLKVLIDEFRTERGIQSIRIRPTHHLMLELRIGEAIKKFPEANDLVTLRNDHEHGEAHVQNSLNDIELLGDFPSFARYVVGGIFD